MSTGRKVFHCAVDDTALTTNISEIKKWTANGAISLIVPLYSKSLPPLRAVLLPADRAFRQPSNVSMR